MAGNPNYDRLISTTLKKYRKQFEDNVFSSKPLLFALANSFGGIMRSDGGTEPVVPLLYAELANKGSYSGADTFSTDDDEGFTAAEYDWGQYYGLIKLNNIDLAKNSGAPAVLRILENEIMRAELSISEGLDQMFWADGSGNGGKDWLGMAAIVSNADPSAGALGGIPVAGNSWWTSNVTTGVGAITDFSEMRTAYIAATEGADSPTHIFTTDDVYAKIDSLFENRQRFENPEMANQGFDSIQFHSAPITFDRNIATGEMYFLNLKYITLEALGDNWFSQSEWMEPVNQDVRYKKIKLYGQLTCSNRKRHSKLEGVS